MRGKRGGECRHDVPHPKLTRVKLSFYLFLFLFETHEALDHPASFPSSRETISQLGIEPPTNLFNLSQFYPLSGGSLQSSWTKLGHGHANTIRPLWLGILEFSLVHKSIAHPYLSLKLMS